MRTHTAMHILCGVIFRDYGASVTGGDMEPLKGRMDFEFETMRGDLPAAERLYRRALERDSTRAIAWQGYGVVSLRLGKLDQAHQAVERLLRLDPDNPQGRSALGGIERMQAARRAAAAR